MGEATPEHISFAPTPGLSYDPQDAKYWDPAALSQEVTRAFAICHGCRMCFKYCDAFPTLFRIIDEAHDGSVQEVTVDETDRVMDACFQCKLCEVQCPYTPRDAHAFQLDFPKLVHRYVAQRARTKGVSARDKVLGDPDKSATLARASLGMANWANRAPAHRWLMEKALGIHRHKLLPPFAANTFERWAARTDRIKGPEGADAVLFQTCYVQHNEPNVGRDTVAVFEHNEVALHCARGLVCCGMPAWEHGDLGTLQQRAATNLAVLAPYVDAGAKVVAINPTCSMMLRREYPGLVAAPDRARAAQVAAAVCDPSEYLWQRRAAGKLKRDFQSSPAGVVSYHAPCHLRAQAIGFKGRDLLRQLPGVERVATVTACCGHDGTYAMKVEGFEASQRVGASAFAAMRAAEAGLWSTDCPLAALQFQQHAGVKPLHPMTVLAKAYRGESFPGGEGAREGKQLEKED